MRSPTCRRSPDASWPEESDTVALLVRDAKAMLRELDADLAPVLRAANTRQLARWLDNDLRPRPLPLEVLEASLARRIANEITQARGHLEWAVIEVCSGGPPPRVFTAVERAAIATIGGAVEEEIAVGFVLASKPAGGIVLASRDSLRAFIEQGVTRSV